MVGGLFLFFLFQKQFDPLADRFAAGDIVFLAIFPQTLFCSDVNPDAVIDTFGIFRLWSACARAQIITSF